MYFIALKHQVLIMYVYDYCYSTLILESFWISDISFVLVPVFKTLEKKKNAGVL